MGWLTSRIAANVTFLKGMVHGFRCRPGETMDPSDITIQAARNHIAVIGASRHRHFPVIAPSMTRPA